MINMLHFLPFLFLGVYAYLTSNENFNFSRHPLLHFRSIQIGKDSDGISGLTQAACHGPGEPLFCYGTKNGIDL